MVHLFEVMYKTRFVKKINSKPAHGYRGSWYYPEGLIAVAKSESEIDDLICKKELTIRERISINRAKKKGLHREIEITNLRRIV